LFSGGIEDPPFPHVFEKLYRAVEFIQELNASLESGFPREKEDAVTGLSIRWIGRSGNDLQTVLQVGIDALSTMVAEATMPGERITRSSCCLTRSPLTEKRNDSRTARQKKLA